MVDQLANDYQSYPVIFLEDNAYTSKGVRKSRFWAAFDASSAYFPLISVDSGHQCMDGYSPTLYEDYQSMVDAELARPPQAEISAVQSRVADHLQFKVTIKNTSGVTLSSAANSATVHVIVYEDARVGVTGRFVRAAPFLAIETPLANNASASFSLETPELSGVDWTKLHAVALVDYRPGGHSGPYDMLQAAMAFGSFFTVQPTSLAFLVDVSSPVDQFRAIRFSGEPAALTWTASVTTPWLAVTPAAGALSDVLTVQVIASLLPPGTQHSATLTLAATAPGLIYQIDVPVTVILGDVSSTYLPSVVRGLGP